jgi:hypothetical protein
MPFYPPAYIVKTASGDDLYKPINGSSVAGVSSVNSLTGAVNLTSTGSSVVISEVGQNINLEVNSINVGVESLNTLQGAINLTSTDDSINFNVQGNNIDLTSNLNVGVESLNAEDGVITITSTDSTVNIATTSGNIDLSVPAVNVGVESLNTEEGAITITSTDASVNIATTSGNIDLSVPTVNVGVETLNGLSGVLNLTSTGSTVAITQVGQNINLETVTVSPTNPNTIEGTATFDLADKLTDVSGKAIATIRAQNGLGGEIDLIANAGSAGINGGKVKVTANGGQVFGEVDIVANPGSAFGVSTGGLVKITANSGFSDITTTSAIKLSAAGINSYAGAIPSIGSLAGYNFIYGTGGVNICAGLPSIIPNVPGTTFVYGTNGVEILPSLYCEFIIPYWDGTSGSANPLKIQGRSLPSALVHIQDVDHIYMAGVGALTGVQTINGNAYPPPAGGVTSLNTLSGAVTLSAGTGISFTTVAQDISISSSVSAVGVAGAIQYSNGSGVFQGNNGLLYNGTSRITNATGANFIDINDTTNSVAIQSNADINITAGPFLSVNSVSTRLNSTDLQVTLNGSNGTAGQVLTSDGTYANWQTPTPEPVYQATYYKSTAQTVISGNTDLTFDQTGSWNNDSGYITHTNGTSAFTVVQEGLYQLQFNVSVISNGAVYLNTTNKGVVIDLLRGTEQAVLVNTALQATATTYNMNVSSTYYLNTGDILTCRIINTFTGGPPTIQGLANVFDLNTFFSWQFVSGGGGSVTAFNPLFIPPIALASGSTTIYPLTDAYNYGQICLDPSGTTPVFNITTLGLTSAFKYCYIKNSSPSGGSGADVQLQHNGVAITGTTGTSILHQRSGTNNTGNSLLYWDGTNLLLY